MQNFKITGYRCKELDVARLRERVEQSNYFSPAVLEAAMDMLAGKTIKDMREGDLAKKGKVESERARARRGMGLIVESDPEKFGYERIPPVMKDVSAQELADHAGVPIARVLKAIKDKDDNDLPEPDKPWGRTIRGRAWRFSPDVANMYVKYLAF